MQLRFSPPPLLPLRTPLFQAWSLTDQGELRSDEVCLEVSGMTSGTIKLAKCHHQRGNQHWEFQEEVSVCFYIFLIF